MVALYSVKRRALINAVKKLSNLVPDLLLKKGTKHALKLHYPSVKYGRACYPLSINGPDLDHWVVEDLIKWLSKNNICSKKKFLELLGK